MTTRRVPLAHLRAGERRLDGPTAHYIATVLRLRAGDEFIGFDPASAQEADGVTIRVDLESVVARFSTPRQGLRAGMSVTWIQGFAKGPKCDAVIRDATELGATRVIVAVSRRSVVSLDSARLRARQHRWERIAEQAARQSGRCEVPRVEAARSWKEALESCDAGCPRFCLWESAEDALGPALLDALACGGAVSFACGPEGGLDDDELALARAKGWALVSLGPPTLRTETVAAAVLGAVRVWSGLHLAQGPT